MSKNSKLREGRVQEGYQPVNARRETEPLEKGHQPAGTPENVKPLTGSKPPSPPPGFSSNVQPPKK